MRRVAVLLAAGLALFGGCARGARGSDTRAAATAAPGSTAAPLGPRERGKASWYGARHHGRTTASGERFDMHALTAAHKRLRFGTRVRVTSLASGKSVEVRINDRGPYARGRIIDLSQAAARRLGMLTAGVVAVELEILSVPPPREKRRH